MSENYKTQGKEMEETKADETNTSFNRTMGTYYESYHNLLSRERSNRSEIVGLKNCMNRVLAAEMIDFKLRSKGSKNATLEY